MAFERIYWFMKAFSEFRYYFFYPSCCYKFIIIFIEPTVVIKNTDFVPIKTRYFIPDKTNQETINHSNHLNTEIEQFNRTFSSQPRHGKSPQSAFSRHDSNPQFACRRPLTTLLNRRFLVAGGYYIFERKTEKVQIVVLNTNLMRKGDNDPDAAAQWEWLLGVMKKLKKNSETVS